MHFNIIIQRWAKSTEYNETLKHELHRTPGQANVMHKCASCILLHALWVDYNVNSTVQLGLHICVLTTNCQGAFRWHNDWSVSVTDGKNQLEMVWKWEAWLCHKQPQWSGPEGIQMGSTWTPLTAQLKGGGGWTGRCVQLCYCTRQYSIHTYIKS